MRDIPVAFWSSTFFMRTANCCIDRPLRERAQILDELLAAAAEVRSPQRHRVTEKTRTSGSSLFEQNAGDEQVAAAQRHPRARVSRRIA